MDKFYYLTKEKNVDGNWICKSVIMTESTNKNPDYEVCTKEEYENALSKMWDGTDWVDNPNN